MGDRVAKDADGKYFVGRVTQATGEKDALAAIRQLERSGSEVARSVSLLSARLPGDPHPSAQVPGPTGAIGGRIVDEQGAVMPGVTITIRGAGDAAPSKVITRQDGTFRATALSDGAYTMTAALAGFTPVEAKDIVVANGELTDLGTVLMNLGGTREPDLKAMGLRPKETAVAFTTSGGNFGLAVSGDTPQRAAAAAFVARIKIRAYDGGTLQPILESQVTGPPRDKALAFVPAPTASVAFEPVYLVGQIVATDVDGKNVIGRVWPSSNLQDAAVIAASRPVGGDERPTPIFIVRAALMYFLLPSPASH